MYRTDRTDNICPSTGLNSWECNCRGCRSWRSPRPAAKPAATAPMPKAAQPASTAAPAPVEAPGTLEDAQRLLASVESVRGFTGRHDHEMIEPFIRTWDSEAAPVVKAACDEWTAWARGVIAAWDALPLHQQTGRAQKSRVEDARRVLATASSVAKRVG